MLGKPMFGWTHIKIGDFETNGSYLTNIPEDALNACLSSVKYGIPFSLFIDGEGTSALICSNDINTYIIHSVDTDELHQYDISTTSLIREIVKDIEENLNDWILWESYNELSVKEFELKKAEFLLKIKEIKSLL